MAEPPQRRRSPASRLAGEMTKLKVALLVGFLIVGIVGLVLAAPAWLGGADSAVQSTSTVQGTDPLPSGSRGFIDPRSTPPGTGQPEEPPPADRPGTTVLGGWLATLGLSFAGGLVLGVFFRSFLKTMAAITAVAVAALVGLSYFEVINVEMATMRQNYEAFMGWLSGQGHQLRQAASGLLPSMFMASIGFVFGFIRR